jgi:hypothetical protein
MNIERLIELIHATPFAPFSLLLPNGEKMRVPHSDYIWVHPDRRTIIAVANDGKTRLLSHQMLVGVEIEGTMA